MPPPPSPPPPASTQRLIKVVPTRPGFRPSFCKLDGEGGGEDSEEEGDPPPPTPFSCASICRTADHHCWNCGRCFTLCPDHSGCTCDPEEEEDEEEEEEEENNCAIWRCSFSVRYILESSKWPYMTDLSAKHPNQALTSTRYPTRPELLFCYPNPTRTIFKNFRVSGFSQQAVSQQAASNLLTIILKFCCFLVALTRNPLFN